MKKGLQMGLTILSLAALSLSAGCKKDAGTLNGAGASFPYPLYSAWAFEYEKAANLKLNYQSIGSGGGVKQITGRTVDFGASDDALKDEQIEKEKLLQWPQVTGGIVVVLNVEGIKSEDLTLDSGAVCKIFLGEIKKINDPAIAALNPGVKIPDAPISVVHRSDGSGTTAVFTHYLAETCPAWKKVGEGKSVNWPVGIGGKGNEGVANYVKQQANSIGYVEYAYAKQNNLAFTLMKNAAGKTVKPSLESFAEAAASGDYDPKKHFYTWATNAKGEGAWPIVAATNVIVAKEKVEANKKVVQFFNWAFDHGDDQAKKLIYAPLPPALKEKIRQYWKENGLL